MGESSPSITEIVSRGLVRCGETLRPMGEMETTGELLERLPRERLFAKSETPAGKREIALGPVPLAGHLNDQMTRFWRGWLESNRGAMPRDR